MAVQRGVYGRNWLTTAIFAIGRSSISPLAWWIIKTHPLGRFGIPRPPTGSPPIEFFGRTFPRIPFLMAAMPGILAAKHAVWMLTYCREPFTWQFAFFGVLADVIYESISTVVFTAAARNPMWSERLFYPGFAVYVSSIVLELAAELQRVAFKSDSKNAGKPCTTGFWGVTRHINYTANVLFGKSLCHVRARETI